MELDPRYTDTLSDAIHFARTRQHKTQKELATEFEISGQMLSNMKSGRMNNVARAVLRLMVDYCATFRNGNGMHPEGE